MGMRRQYGNRNCDNGGFAFCVSVLRLWSYDRQLKEWAEQLTQTDEYSNLRLGTSVRSRAPLNCCRAVNERLERGSRRASARKV